MSTQAKTFDSNHTPSTPGGSASRVNRVDELDAFSGDRSFVMSFARGMCVIQAFANVSRPMTIAELSHRTDIPRAAVRRLLHTLAELGYVHSIGVRYALTPKTLGLGHAFTSSNDIAIAMQPIVSELAYRFGAFCALSVPDDDYTMLMSIAGSTRVDVSRQLTPSVGGKVPLYASASGQIFLSQFSDAQLEAYFARVAMRPYTFRTPTLPSQLRETLRTVRTQEYAVADRVFANDLRSVAVPVVDPEGMVVAAMVTVIATDRATELDLRSTLLPGLRKAASEAASRWH